MTIYASIYLGLHLIGIIFADKTKDRVSIFLTAMMAVPFIGRALGWF